MDRKGADKKGPPKESPKQRKARLQREKEEREATERADLEREHGSLATTYEQEEQAAWWELISEFWRQKCTDLSVERSVYTDIVNRFEEESSAREEEMGRLSHELEVTLKAKAKFEAELHEIRLDQKLQVMHLPKKIQDLQDRMTEALNVAIARFEEARHADEQAVMKTFCFEFGKHKQRYLDILYEMKDKVRHFSQVLTESKSMHSNLPLRIRQQLERTPKEELLFMFDTLSYEDGVVQYFESKFPKLQPQRWSTEVKPSDQLLQVEQEAAKAAAEAPGRPADSRVAAAPSPPPAAPAAAAID